MANFAASSVGACVPSTISFTDLSVGPVASYSWDFGNGVSSSFTSPSVVYNKAGDYKVTLTVEDASGVKSTSSQRIRIYKTPSINFSPDLSEVCERTNVQFINNSKEGDTTIKTWLWDFGDGNSSSFQDPYHSYFNAGKYRVQLYATDQFGCSADTSINNVIDVKDSPISAFEFDENRSCKAPISVEFRNLTNHSNTTYLWEFGDGSTSTNANPVHEYSSMGSYPVRLIATHANGCKDSIQITGDIEIAKLKVDFAVPDTTLCIGDTVILEERIQPRLTSPTQFKWVFQDGSTKWGRTVIIPLRSANEEIKLEVSNASCRGSTKKTINANSPPANSMELSNKILCGNQSSVLFKMDTTGIASFNWRIDQSYNRTSIMGTERFDLEGPHYFQLYLNGRNGCSAIFYDTVYRSNPEIVGTKDTGACIPYSFNPQAELIGVYGLKSIYWDLEDFSRGKDSNLRPATLSITDTGYAYLDFTVVDEIGCEFKESWQIGGGDNPTASFIISDDTVCNGEIITLTNTSSKPNYPTDFYWKIGTFTGEDKEWSKKVKMLPDTYSISHIVSHYGCKDTLIKDNQVRVNGPYANFFISSDSCIASYKTVLGQVLDADSFYYQVNGVSLMTDTSFNQSFKNGDVLKLIALKNSSVCMDSITQMISVAGDKVLDWEVNAGQCAPAAIEVMRQDENLDSIKWYINGVDMLHKSKTLVTSLNSGGDVSISLRGYAGKGCDLSLDTTIKVKGPRLKTYIAQSHGCLPKTFSLIDSFWNNSGKRYWVINEDTVAANGINTTYVLDGVQDPSNKIIKVVLVAEEDGCFSRKQFNYFLPGVSFTSSFKDSIISCYNSKFTFNIHANKDEIDRVDSYTLSYNGIEESNFSGVFSKEIRLDGQIDTVYLSINSIDGCRNTQMLVLPNTNPALEAMFSSTKAKANCPPLFVEFSDDSYSKFGEIVRREWKIDEVYFSDLKQPSRLFSKPGNYKVSLKVEDDRGCIDSISIDSFVQIKGETVNVDFGEQDLCLGDSISCKVIVGQALNYEWDMGDGSVVNNDSFSFLYRDTGSYEIKILVSDTNQCKYSFSSEYITTVHSLPEALLSIENPCAESEVLLADISLGTADLVNRKWTINGLDQLSKADSISYLSSIDNLRVKLWVEDGHSCVDELDSLVKIYDLDADFTLDKSFYCLHDSAILYTHVDSDTALWSTDYFINDSLVANKYIDKVLYGKEGEYDLQLIAIDVLGCRDSSEAKKLKIAGPDTSDEVELLNASFKEDNVIEVIHSQSASSYFDRYQLIDENDLVLLEERDVMNTSFSVPTLANPRSVHCFKLGVNNGCYALDASNLDLHCTIHVTGQPSVNSKRLSWTPYVGWEVKSYEVYKMLDRSWVLIGQVPANENELIDSNLSRCDSADIYRVVAIGDFNTSKSDTVHIKPILDYSLEAPLIQNVSVLSNEEIVLIIDSNNATSIPIKHYNIERYFKGQLEPLLSFESSYIDVTVTPQEGSYQYRVSQIDQCGTQSDTSNAVRSIHLDVRSHASSAFPFLRWNKPLLWNNQIDYYIIYRIIGQHKEELTRVFNRDDTSYTDESINLACAQNMCYEVVAVSKDGLWESRSNINCGGAYSTLFVPNAASPNNDLLNDHFQPVGMFIEEYEMTIYNRWGQVIFTTDECMQSWDCTIKGEAAPMGTYIYNITARGADGKQFNLNGAFHLIK